MDVQKTIEFILEQQAQCAAWRTDMTAWRSEMSAVQAKTGKRLDAIAKLLKTGMKMLVDYQRETNGKINALVDAQMRNEEGFRQLREDMVQLRESQQKTDEKFNRWLDAQRGGSTNGH